MSSSCIPPSLAFPNELFLGTNTEVSSLTIGAARPVCGTFNCFSGFWQPTTHDGFTRTLISDTEKDNAYTFMFKWEILQNIAKSQQAESLMTVFLSLGFRPEKFLIWSWKHIHRKSPMGCSTNSTIYLKSLSTSELLGVMEVLNELGFLEEGRHAPHVKPIIKTQS